MKTPAQKRRGAWEGMWAGLPTGNSPVPVIPDWTGEEAMCFVAGPLWTFAGPESSGPPTPHPVAVCDCEGLAACLATRRRISGFVDLETEIAPDCLDGGSTGWIRQDRLRLAGLVVRANEHRLVVVFVRDPVAIRVGHQDGSAVGQLQPKGRAAASGPQDLKTQVVERRQENLGFVGFQGEAGAVTVHRQFNNLDN